MPIPSPRPNHARDSRLSLSRLLVIAVAALVVRGAWLLLMTTQFSGQEYHRVMEDSRRYVDTARYLLGEPVEGDFHSETGSKVYRTGEGALVWSGPGYGAFLAACLTLLGESDLPILIFQILLSATSCVIVALIAHRLLGCARVSLIAGMICTLSLTSVSLSCALLSDTLFFTLFAASVWALVRAFQSQHWAWFVLGGVVIAASVYVRAVAQFWPGAVVLLALLLPARFLGMPRRRAILRASVTCIVAVVCILPFFIRNYIKHDIFAFTSAGPMAARYYWTARALANLDPNAGRRDEQKRMHDDNIARYGPEGATIGEYYRDDMRIFKSTLRKHPALMAKTYIKSALENTTRGSDLHPLQLPQYKRFWDQVQPFIFLRIGPVILALTLLGMIILLSSRESRGAGLILLLTYGYHTGISGFEYWQGSRICHPAMIAWAILLAVVLDRVFALVLKRGAALPGEFATAHETAS